MTREEFFRYCWDGPQWTPETLAAVRLARSGFLPKGDIETFERECKRPDGVIEVEPMTPLFCESSLMANNIAVQNHGLSKGQ